MGIIKEYEKGDTARFRAVFKNTQGDVVEPDYKDDDHMVDIEITDLSADEIMVSTTDMDEISDTQFRYDWQTTEGMTEGEYEVEVRGEFGGDTALNRDRFKLVRTTTSR